MNRVLYLLVGAVVSMVHAECEKDKSFGTAGNAITVISKGSGVVADISFTGMATSEQNGDMALVGPVAIGSGKAHRLALVTHDRDGKNTMQVVTSLGFAPVEDCFPSSVTYDNNGGIIVVGSVYHGSQKAPFNYDFFVARYIQTTLRFDWVTYRGSSNNAEDQGTGVAVSNRFISVSGSAKDEAVILRFRPTSGQFDSQEVFTFEGVSKFNAICVGDGDDVFAAGEVNLKSGETVFAIGKLGGNNQQQQTTTRIEGGDIAQAIAFQENFIVVAGTSLVGAGTSVTIVRYRTNNLQIDFKSTANIDSYPYASVSGVVLQNGNVLVGGSGTSNIGENTGFVATFSSSNGKFRGESLIDFGTSETTVAGIGKQGNDVIVAGKSGTKTSRFYSAGFARLYCDGTGEAVVTKSPAGPIAPPTKKRRKPNKTLKPTTGMPSSSPSKTPTVLSTKTPTKKPKNPTKRKK